MTTSSEQVVARVGKSPSDYYDYTDPDYTYDQCTSTKLLLALARQHIFALE